MAFGDEKRMAEREKSIVRARSISNYVMGVLLIAAGFFFLFPIAATEEQLKQFDPVMIKVFAVVCWVYGLFRIYRGYQKNYFRER